MTPLLILLILKITVTLIFVSAPFLLFPKKKIDGILKIHGETTGLYRLYGVAISALLVGYAGGLYILLGGVLPTQAILMGIVSNTGAASAMLMTGMVKNNKMLTIFFSIIAIGLILTLIFPEYAMRPL